MNELLEKGVRRLEWAKDHMPVLADIRKRMVDEQALKGLKIGMALHVEAKTGMLALTLAEAGAEIRLASCNPLSTDDSVSVALRDHFNLETYAKKGEDNEEYYKNLNAVLDLKPDFVIDDGADLITMLHTSRRDVLKNVKGGNEETTTGVVRLRSMANAGKLEFPVISINDAHMKFMFDNRYGTGQSTFDGFMNATNLLVAGKRLVVAGYGWCGRGIAMRAKGLGANVTVTEIDPIRAIEARMDGFEVKPMIEAVKTADIIITATGNKDIIREEHFKVMKDGCVMGNSGHFDNEIRKDVLSKISGQPVKVREFVDQYNFSDGKKVYLIADGRLMNLSAGQGHPVEIMDMSFSIQALSIEHLVKNYASMEAGVHNVPTDIDRSVAEIKLKTLGIQIDSLTNEQKTYLEGWQEGT